MQLRALFHFNLISESNYTCVYYCKRKETNLNHLNFVCSDQTLALHKDSVVLEKYCKRFTEIKQKEQLLI